MTARPEPAATQAAAGAGLVLLTLASAQFLMTLDSSVMNVSIAQVAKDVDTTVTGVQTAITLYTLVMATLMITGGKIGSMIGRRRAFAIGCVIYGAGSFTTALAPNLAVLIIGWSFLEGIGAALIMPAIVALVASNFAAPERPRAYGLVASAGAIAVAAGPLIGGACTTYLTWRVVFAGEVLIVAVILVLSRKIRDAPSEGHTSLDLVGVVLSAAGLGLAVFGVLRSGEWGWVAGQARRAVAVGHLVHRLADPGRNRDHPDLLLVGAADVGRGAGAPGRPHDAAQPAPGGRAHHVLLPVPDPGRAVLHRPAVPVGGARSERGRDRRPTAAALGHPAGGGRRSAQGLAAGVAALVVNWGLAALLAGIVSLIAALEAGAGPEIVTVPLLFAGLGVGALASQLGAVTVSSVPDEQSGEVGGLQNTATNLGASLGTALAGSVLIGALTASFISGVQDNPDVPAEVSAAAEVELAGGIPFISDADLEDALDDTELPQAQVDAVVDENESARIAGLRLAWRCSP